MDEFPDGCDDVEYYEWIKVDGKVKKVVKSADVEKAIELFNEQVKQMNSKFMSTPAKIKKIKNKTKSKVLISGIIHFQYLRRVTTHMGLMVHY